MIRVCSITEASRKLVERLPDNLGGIPILVGWNGEQIAIFSSTYKSPTKSLPYVRLVILPGMQFDEIEMLLALTVAGLIRKLPQALTRGAQRPATKSHAWRRSSIARKRGGA